MKSLREYLSSENIKISKVDGYSVKDRCYYGDIDTDSENATRLALTFGCNIRLIEDAVKTHLYDFQEMVEDFDRKLM